MQEPVQHREQYPTFLVLGSIALAISGPAHLPWLAFIGLVFWLPAMWVALTRAVAWWHKPRPFNSWVAWAKEEYVAGRMTLDEFERGLDATGHARSG
jgi:hypothetical protein